MATIPLLFVAYNSLQLSASQWSGLWGSRLPMLLGNTLSLALLVGVICLLLGVSSAWLLARREFVGRRLAIWLLVLPLAIPTYVFAHIYTVLLEPDAWLGQAWQAIVGSGATIDIYNLGGTAMVLALATFSYVFFLAYSSIIESRRSLDDAARIHGASKIDVFRCITLPMMRPALAAGLAVVVLHVLSDFGAVSMLRYQTFTSSIYLQMSGRYDYQSAAALSLILVMMSLTFLVLERFFRSKQRYFAGAQTRYLKRKPASMGEVLLIWAWLGLIILFAFIIPLSWMVVWTAKALAGGMISSKFWGYAFNSGVVSFGAATVAVIAALPIGLFHSRLRSWLSNTYIQLSSVGFVLPGPVIALGVITFMIVAMPNLYGSLLALIFALVVRFLPLAIQAQESALQQLTPSIELAGRIHGAGPFENLYRVILPMIRNGMITAWVLVFIDVLKELPATLMLRPVGFDTLPVRIWIEASEEMLELAAPAALTLVIGTLPVLYIMMRSQRDVGR
jgi:iron(III) transport system permease protein